MVPIRVTRYMVSTVHEWCPICVVPYMCGTLYVVSYIGGPYLWLDIWVVPICGTLYGWSLYVVRFMGDLYMWYALWVVPICGTLYWWSLYVVRFMGGSYM